MAVPADVYKRQALENYLASDAAAEAATLSLIAQVADSYLSLRELDERLALTRETIASREESLRIFRRRYEMCIRDRIQGDAIPRAERTQALDNALFQYTE